MLLLSKSLLHHLEQIVVLAHIHKFLTSNVKKVPLYDLHQKSLIIRPRFMYLKTSLRFAIIFPYCCTELYQKPIFKTIFFCHKIHLQQYRLFPTYNRQKVKDLSITVLKELSLVISILLFPTGNSFKSWFVHPFITNVLTFTLRKTTIVRVGSRVSRVLTFDAVSVIVALIVDWGLFAWTLSLTFTTFEYFQ